MLKKDILRSLRSLNATDKMVKMAAENESYEIYTKGEELFKKRREYALYLRAQNLKGYLKIAFFLPSNINNGVLTPIYELFINPQTNEYIGRDLDADGKEIEWRYIYAVNVIDRIKDYSSYQYWYYSKKASWINPEGAATIKKVLKVNTGDVYGITEWQKKVRKAKKDEKEQRKLQGWDNDMALVPELPQDFARWTLKKALEKNYVIYNKDKGIYWCTYCEKEYAIRELPMIKTKFRHNKQGKCENCDRNVEYKNEKQMAQTIYSENKCVEIIQALNNKKGIVIERVAVYAKWEKTSYKTPQIYTSSQTRTLFRDASCIQYEWEWYKNSYHRWCKKPVIYRYTYSIGKLYTPNIRHLTRTVLKESAFSIFRKKTKKRISLINFFEEEQQNPALEKLVKCGLIYIAEDMLDNMKYANMYDTEKSELTKILKLDKSRLTRLKNYDKARIYHLAWLQAEKRENTKYNDEMIEFFGKTNYMPDSFEFVRQHGQITYIQIYNYIRKHMKVTGEDIHKTVGTWRDYLNMAKKVGMQLSNEQIYKPKDLNAKHAEMIVLLQQEGIDKQTKELEKKWPKVNSTCQTLKKYEYSNDTYAVIAPVGVRDIVLEGTILSHCVHTCDYYFDRIQRKESYLLFLRKKSSVDTPYYTLEVEPSGNIRQKRTTGDNQNKDFEDAIEFLKDWQQVISQRLTDEDKDLGQKSNELRKKNYEELRKNGNKVWHGKLAGKLLADVLEDDFMQVI